MSNSSLNSKNVKNLKKRLIVFGVEAKVKANLGPACNEIRDSNRAGWSEGK